MADDADAKTARDSRWLQNSNKHKLPDKLLKLVDAERNVKREDVGKRQRGLRGEEGVLRGHAISD